MSSSADETTSIRVLVADDEPGVRFTYEEVLVLRTVARHAHCRM